MTFEGRETGMTNVISLEKARRELAHRKADGIEVTLLWDASDDTVTVEVFDAGTDESFEIGVPRDRALDAFHHPFAYAA
jgi:hypothetical protein